MAPHTRFKLAVIRTMRCDFCNKGNDDGLQECQDCNMHFCRECIEDGRLNNDERHRMQQDVIDNLNWNKPPKGRRPAHSRTTTVDESASSREQRRQRRAEMRSLRPAPPHSGVQDEPSLYFQSPQDPMFQPHMGPFPGVDFNVPPGNNDHPGHNHGHGHFQHDAAPPSYPPGFSPGYAASIPAHAMPYGFPSSGPGQHGQHPNQGGLAMPFGPFYGHQLPVNPGPLPRGDPRLHTPPGQQFAQIGYAIPNNFGGYYGGHQMGYTPAPTPQGFAGLGFGQQPSQPQAMYNDRGYVPGGNTPTRQPVSSPGHTSGQPYGGGPFPYAPPHQEQARPRGQEDERAPGEQAPQTSEPPRDARARDPVSHGHAEQPFDPVAIQRQQQQQAWEREQAQQVWEQQQARLAWERQQQQQAMLQMWGQSQQQQQPMQQTAQPMAGQQQSEERQQYETQPAAQQASQTAPQAQKQDEQRQERHEEQQSQPQAVRPNSEGGAVSGAAPVTASSGTLPPVVAPPTTDPSFTLPPITTPPVTVSSTSIPPITALSLQEAQPPVSAQAPRPSTPEPDTTSQLPQSQPSEAHPTPNAVTHAHRPFGIPALARDLYTGRPNHYDETAARWAARPPRQYDEDDYDDYDEDATDTDTDRAQPGSPSDRQPHSRGQKRTLSRASSVDSTLSAELNQQVADADAAAVVPGTEALRRELRDDADISRARREGGERAALDMAAAANTLQGGGRGLGGVADAQVVANDREIQRRQEIADRAWRREEERRAVEPPKKKPRGGGGGSGGDARGGGGVR